MNREDSVDDDVDTFIHFDTNSSDLDGDGNLRITLQKDGWYWIGIKNIRLLFPDGYTPDNFIGYIGITGTNVPPSSITTMIGANKIGKSLFPVNDPTSTTPVVSSYNKMQLGSQDQLQLVYYDNNLSIVPLGRLVGTLHISNNPDIIRITL